MLANKWRRESKLNPEKCDLAFSGTGGSDGYQRIVEALREGEVGFIFRPTITSQFFIVSRF